MAAPQGSTLFSPSGLGLTELAANHFADIHLHPYIAQAQLFGDTSLRMIVAPHLGGGSLRVRLGNRFGARPLAVDGVFVGIEQSGAALVPGSNRPVRFGGRDEVVIAPGGEAVSDPVTLDTQPFQNLAVSAHVEGWFKSVDYHLDAQQVSYLSGRSGSYGAREDASEFNREVSSWYMLSGVDVLTDAAISAIVAFGDSLDDGAMSSYGANARWPDDLARRMAAAGIPRAVLNAGIAGNFVAADSWLVGPSGEARLARDALDRAGVTTIILSEGINDISRAPEDPMTAQRIIAADQSIIAQAHAVGLRVLGATLTPTLGSRATRVGEPGMPQQIRHRINDWIRSSGAFDGVVDFEAALRDPAQPDRYASSLDSGDHLHPNDKGYRALADAMDLSLLQDAHNCP